MRLIFFFLFLGRGLGCRFSGRLLRRRLFLLFLGRLCLTGLGRGSKYISQARRLIMLSQILKYNIKLVILKNLHMVFRSRSIVS